MRSLIILPLFCVSLSSLATEFEIFTLGDESLSDSAATVYRIDQGDRLLESINKEMQRIGITTEEQGKHFATPELSEALSNQVRGLLKAGRYQLKYFPAIVIDGQYVIYGTTDISRFGEMKP